MPQTVLCPAQSVHCVKDVRPRGVRDNEQHPKKEFDVHFKRAQLEFEHPQIESAQPNAQQNASEYLANDDQRSD